MSRERGLNAEVAAAPTGATGDIGGRLVPELLSANFRVRVMARQPQHLADRPWHDQVKIVQGDATDADSLAEALRGVAVAYYLIHSVGTGAHFESLDRARARNFASAAGDGAVNRIVYLNT